MEKYKKSYMNNKCEISAPTWNEEFELPDGSYFDQIFKIILSILKKKHGEKTINPSITLERIRLLGSTESKITKNENDKNVPNLEITKVVLVHCNIVKNDYQQDSKVLHPFVSNKSFGQLLDISPKNSLFLNTFNSEFSYIEVWFTDQNSRSLDIEDRINLTSVTD